jgi:hypothetical protein
MRTNQLDTLVPLPDDPSQGRSLITHMPLTSEAVQRLRGMFLDVPGTRLSVADAARLSGVENWICLQVLEVLTHTHFLRRGQDGSFTRQQADTVDS